MREDSGRMGVGWNDNERTCFVSCCRTDGQRSSFIGLDRNGAGPAAVGEGAVRAPHTTHRRAVLPPVLPLLPRPLSFWYVRVFIFFYIHVLFMCVDVSSLFTICSCVLMFHLYSQSVVFGLQTCRVLGRRLGARRPGCSDRGNSD